MANVRSVGAYLYKAYYSDNSEYMDEMKMHKLMYFSQRESLMLYDKCLFEEDFYGWKYGPVLKSVRLEFRNDKPYSKVVINLSKEEKKLLDGVLERYGKLNSWILSSLSHAELSWRQARKGLEEGENGDVKMQLSAMKVDAAREKAFRKGISS